MEKKLYNLKMKILKSKSINDNFKKELADEILQIEKQLAINYSQCCEKLKDKKAPSFKDWKKIKQITENNELFYLNGKRYYYKEIYKIYKEWCEIHF